MQGGPKSEEDAVAAAKQYAESMSLVENNLKEKAKVCSHVSLVAVGYQLRRAFNGALRLLKADGDLWLPCHLHKLTKLL